MEYTERFGVSMRYLRAALPTMTCSRSSRATTEGTRLSPSSPGITTGLSPCRKATSEFVVPRSIPTMRSGICTQYSALGIWQFAKCQLAFQNFVHVSNQISYVGTAVQQVHHLVANFAATFFRAANDLLVPFVPVP